MVSAVGEAAQYRYRYKKKPKYLYDLCDSRDWPRQTNSNTAVPIMYQAGPSGDPTSPKNAARSITAS